MNRRQTLLALTSLVTLGTTIGCAATTDPHMVVDDGVTEIMPNYIVAYTAGQTTAFVRANFSFFDAKKQVRLRSDGAIKVNGVMLQLDPKTLTSYIADIPASTTFAFELTRQAGKVVTHRFELPQLEIVEFPQQYEGVDPLRAKVESGPAPKGVSYDKYGMTISGRFGESWFKSEFETPDPTMLVLRSTQYSASPPGKYRADLYRQQRVALSDISDTRYGMAVLSHGHNFLIEVVPRFGGK